MSVSPALVLGAWVLGSIVLGVAGGWLLRRSRRTETRAAGMSLHAVEASLRPRGGHVESSPIEAPHSTNGKGGS